MMRLAAWGRSLGSLLIAPVLATGTAHAAEPPTDAAETPRVLRGAEEGTVFRSLTVTGEDRVHIEFDRPDLRVDLDPRDAPGLEWGDSMDVLERSGPDLVEPLRAGSALDRSPFLPRPWLAELRSGAVARFRPDLESVSAWKLTIADSRSDTLAVFEGEGSPPDEIAWNGRTRDGDLVPPGVTCSYVLEAIDRAGNRRSFVGQGFALPAYRVGDGGGTALLFPAAALGDAGAAAPDPPAVLLEAASWLNQLPVDGSIEVRVRAASFEDANRLATGLVEWLRPRVAGDAARLRPVADVRADVPGAGVVTISHLAREPSSP